MIARARARRDAGFTLLEMLLALAMLALITSTILGGMHFGKRAWQTGQTYDASGEIEAAAMAISELLRRSFPAVVTAVGKRPTVVFYGGPDGCRFTMLSEGETQRAGLILTEIGVRSNGGRNDLALWTKVFRPQTALAATTEEMEEASVLHDVASFDLAYFGAVESDSSPTWRSSWTDADRLPHLVSVRLAAVRGGRRIEISFFIALPQA
jgi:general secretion pathway protein J